MAPDADPYRTLGLTARRHARRGAPRLPTAGQGQPPGCGRRGGPATIPGDPGRLRHDRRPRFRDDAGRARPDRRRPAAGLGSRSRPRRRDVPGLRRPAAPGAPDRWGGSGARTAARTPPGSGRPTGAPGARPPRPERPPNKATLGSTSYDGADAEPFEPDWGGASWYGTTSGTYWTLNPKEYADPRKHGPEYQARARRELHGRDEAGDRPGRTAVRGPSVRVGGASRAEPARRRPADEAAAGHAHDLVVVGGHGRSCAASRGRAVRSSRPARDGPPRGSARRHAPRGTTRRAPARGAGRPATAPARLGCRGPGPSRLRPHAGGHPRGRSARGWTTTAPAPSAGSPGPSSAGRRSRSGSAGSAARSPDAGASPRAATTRSVMSAWLVQIAALVRADRRRPPRPDRVGRHAGDARRRDPGRAAAVGHREPGRHGRRPDRAERPARDRLGRRARVRHRRARSVGPPLRRRGPPGVAGPSRPVS